MTLSVFLRLLAVIFLMLGSAACALSPQTEARTPAPLETAIVEEAQVEQETSRSPILQTREPIQSRPVQKEVGTGNFVNQSLERRVDEQEGGYEIVLDEVTIEDAAEAILGKILNESYVIDNQVNNRITLRSGRPLSADGVLSLFQSALGAIGAELSYDGVLYRIARAGTSTDTIRQLRREGQSDGLVIISLDSVSAIEMARILEPVAPPGAIVRVDAARNLLVLDGSAPELTSMQDLIAVFDRDWMSGMSVAILPIEGVDPQAVVSDLTALFGTEAGGPAEGLIRFIPNQRLSSVLAISARASLLERAETWVQTLNGSDQRSNDQIEIYEVQNRIAADLAEVLQAIGPGTRSDNGPLAPGADAVTVTGRFAPGAGGGGESRNTSSIIVDEDNNSLIIIGDVHRRDTLLTLAKRLDNIPHQVLIEATIAEVSLVDELELGVQWFFEQGDGQAILSDTVTGSVASQFPGFSFLLEGTDAGVVVNALSAVTDVKVVSSPAIMVLNNQTATLQVGDQVPVTTQSAQSVTNADTPIINSVELRDTGILLTVTPRVNEEGRVLLEIQQEVSDVVATTSSGIDSPTIQQRRIETTVIVGNEETLMLGGLIQDSENEVITGIPVLRSIPLLGRLFRSQGTDEERTELLILISPRVIRNGDEARRVTEEYRLRVPDADLLTGTIK